MSSLSTIDQIEPFYFGPPTGRLFGCYHEPPSWPARDQGVVLCYPSGQEYIRSHRACHHLAARLARAGFPTLRFDYSATGDSAGDDQEAGLEQWTVDLRLAVDELKARGGVEQVIVVGLRMGASLALMAAPGIPGLAGLVLWEPVVDGRRYLAELQARHDETIMRFFTRPKDYVPGAPVTELLGFAVGDGLLDATERLDLLQLPAPRGKPVLLIESHDKPEIAELHEHLQRGARSTHIKVPSFTVWVEDVDKGLVPQQVIEAIAGWLDRSFA